MPAPYRYWIGPWQWTGGDLPGYQAPADVIALIDLRSIPRQSVDDHGDGVGNGFFATPATSDLGSDYTLLGEGYVSEIHGDGGARSAWQSLFGINPQGSTLTDYLAYSLTDGSDPTGDAGPKPLCPGVVPENDAQIHLSGHSVVWRQSIDVVRGQSQHARKLRDMMRRDLRAIADNDPDPDLWRRVVGDQKRKYGQKWDEDAEDWIVPASLKSRGKGKNGKTFANQPKTSYTESWPTDSAITSGQDNGWTEFMGSGQTVSSGQLTGSGATEWKVARMTSALSSADHWSELVWKSYSGGSPAAGTITRKDSSGTATCYMGYKYIPVPDYALGKWVSAAFTALGTSSTYNSAADDVHRLTSNGSAISIHINGTSRIAVTDTSITTGTYAGVQNYISGGSVSTDSWACADIGGGGGGASKPVLFHAYYQNQGMRR